MLLLSVHLAMNHAAVRAVNMHNVNRQRANILFSAFWDCNRALSPKEVSHQERIFEWDGALRWSGSAPFARAHIGVSLQTLLSSLAPAHAATGSIRDAKIQLRKLLELFGREMYLLSHDATKGVAFIVLKEGATPASSFKAWAHALLLSHRLNNLHATSATEIDISDLLQSSLTELTRRWDDFLKQLTVAGWDMDVANLETASGTRLRLNANSNSDEGKGN